MTFAFLVTALSFPLLHLICSLTNDLFRRLYSICRLFLDIISALCVSLARLKMGFISLLCTVMCNVSLSISPPVYLSPVCKVASSLFFPLSSTEPVSVNVYGAQESIPRNRFHQAGNRFLGSLNSLQIRALFLYSLTPRRRLYSEPELVNPGIDY